ncbi:MAG: Thermophilic serine proteinase precursor, partial [Acidobacteria bacterium]|nr:Thermophilic serine proteinase precursor [Acidobacteriota bacterium]
MKIFHRSEARFEWAKSRTILFILIALMLVSAAFAAKSTRFGKQRLATGNLYASVVTGNSASPGNKSAGSKDANERTANPSSVQVFGPIEPSVIAGGGGNSLSSSFLLNGTLGESAAGVAMSNGQFSLESGFWQATSSLILPPPNISGQLIYENGTTAAKNVTMTLTGTSGFVPRTTITDVNGNYAFPNVPAGNNYTVTPSRAAEVHDPSITAFDASRAARFDAHLLGLTTNQQIAGDSSNNGSCTVFDASQIARYELSIPTPGSIAGSWKFIPASLSYSNLNASQANQNLTAILVGDISGNWTPSGPITSGPSSPEGTATIPVSLPIKQDPPGGPSTIPVTVGPTTGQGIGAYAFDISFNQAVLTPQATPFDTTGT